MPGIFLNFRSADAGSYAAALLDEMLGALFGPDQVFRSSRSISAGAPFDHVLLEGINTCDVLLSLIGPEWLRASDPEGHRLLDRPGDWVRREIAIALRRGIPVIPVLLTGAQRPARADLPVDIAGMADRQAVYLRHRHIGPDLAHLLSELIRVAPGLTAAGIFAPATSLPGNFTPSMLLRPEYAVVPFSGRQAEVADLLNWCTDDPMLAARLITGPAGQGKTRLALQLCELMRSRGWLAGMVTEDAGAEVMTRIAGVQVPLLLVVDYAEARTEPLLNLAKAVIRRASGSPVRLLLLARSAGEWLRGLHEHRDDRVAGLFLRAGEQYLRPLARGVADRHAEFSRALNAMAYRLSRAADQIDPPPDIDTTRFERALDIHAAALAVLLDESAEEESSDPQLDPIARILHHERRYWRRTTAIYELPNPNVTRLDSMVAVATLFGAVTSEAATELLGALPTFHGEKREVVTRYAHWFKDLYPGPLALNPLRPDRLGEDHVAAALADEPAIATIPVSTVDDSRLRQAVTVLGRGAPRHPAAAGALADVAATAGTRFVDVAIGVATQLEDPRPLVNVLERAVAGSTEPDLINSVLAKLPESTLALAELAVLANERALETHLRLPGRDPAVTAYLLSGLTRRLRQRGRYDDALVAITECAEIYRRLAANDQDAFLPNFVSAMHMRSVCLSDLDQRAEALDAGTVAVAGFRMLAEAHPDSYTSELANSLTALSNRFKAVGHRQDAVAAAREATELYLRLWDDGKAQIVMPDLARSLNNLAVHLAGIGQPGQALDVLDDAIDLRRRLAGHNPDAFLPDLASSLNNRANLLDDLNRDDEATSAIAETIEIYRRLAEHRPEAFLADLAMALGNYAVNAAALKQTADALAASQESVTLYRSLAERRPDMYRPDLAMALNNLSLRLAQAGRPKDSLDAVTESVRIRRGLLPAEDREIRHGLVASLNNLAIRLGTLERYEEAATAAHEAVDVCRTLTDQEQAYRPSLADALNSLAIAELRLGHVDESAAAASEASALFRTLHGTQPSTYQRRLASALTNYADAVRGRDPNLSAALLTEARDLCDPTTDADLAQHIKSSLNALGHSGADDSLS